MTPRSFWLKMIRTALPEPVKTSIRLLPSKVSAAPGETRPSCFTSPSTMTRKRVRSKTATVTCTADEVVGAEVTSEPGVGREGSRVGSAVESSITVLGMLSAEVGVTMDVARRTSEMDGPWVGLVDEVEPVKIR